MQFPGKLTNQTSENVKKKTTTTLGPMLVRLVQIWTPINFMYILPLLVARHCPKLSSYAMLNKTNEPNLRKKQKT